MRRVTIRGDSMRPLLEPGDRLLVFRSCRLHPGDLVALPDPRALGRLLVKRLVAMRAGLAIVHGDNATASTDSRTFGPVPRRALRGRVVYRYGPDHRRGRLGR